MGDRIAILREGGVLAQYDTPDEILARPADEFVARFVGADRGLKRLSLRRSASSTCSSPTRPGADATARCSTGELARSAVDADAPDRLLR